MTPQGDREDRYYAGPSLRQRGARAADRQPRQQPVRGTGAGILPKPLHDLVSVDQAILLPSKTAHRYRSPFAPDNAEPREPRSRGPTERAAAGSRFGTSSSWADLLDNFR